MLDRHGEFVFTIHVRRDPPHSNNPVRSSILWVRVLHQLIWFHPLKLTFSTCICVVVAQQWHGHDAVWGFGKRTVGGARDGGGDWVVRTSHFYGSHKGSWKNTATYAGCVHFTVDWLFWNLYGSYIAPRSLLSWKKPGNFSFDNMGPLKQIALSDWGAFYPTHGGVLPHRLG